MSDAKKFRFVSPGIFLNEIDQSYLSAQPTVVGPVIIGRTEKGPGMIPVKVGTFSEFVNVFGNPIAGNGAVDDVWRDGNYTSPTYGAYAAQAYLRAGVGPVTFVRLMGTQHPGATADTGEAGWTTTKTYSTTPAANGGAYGLYVWPSGSDDTDGYQELTTGSLAAIWYMDSGSLPVLSGNTVDLGSDARPFEGPAIPIKSDSSGQFKVRVLRGQTSATATITVTDFNEIGTSNTITVTTTNLSTVTITGHGSTTSMADATGDSSNGLFASVTNNNTTATNIKTAFNTHDELSATVDGPVVTITQLVGGSTGNTELTFVDPGTDGMTKTDFTGGAETEDENATFSLNPDSDNFIRKMFNTNPIKVNSDLTESGRKYYWLGETYERHLTENSLNTPAVRYGLIAAVATGSTGNDGPYEKKMAYRDAMTGWFFAQNTSADYASYEYDNMTKLFKFAGINGHGQWLQNNIKISIDTIRASSNDNVPYGSFDVLVRRARDNDMAPEILERFSGCSLDPSSMDYVAIKIGDTFRAWDDDEDRYRTFGNYPNRSKFIRIIMEEDVDMGAADASLLPFGVYGPPRYNMLNFSSASVGPEDKSGDLLERAGTTGASVVVVPNGYAQTVGVIPHIYTSQGTRFANVFATGYDFGTASIHFPAVGIRSTGQQDGATPTKNAYYGLHTGKTGSSAVFDPGYPDYLRSLGEGQPAAWTDTWDLTNYGEALEPQWTFSLDEIVVSTDTGFASSSPTKLIKSATWTSGSLKANTSWNAIGADSLGLVRYQNILDSNINRFTTPLFGGFDGFDIKERDPFRNSLLDDSSSETESYSYYTVKRAINTVADPEVVECNAISVPGLTEDTLTKYLIDVCEERADSLGVIDIEGGFQPRHEVDYTTTISSRRGNTATVISNMKARNLNNSYGCCYYPWVTVRDSINSTMLKVPPSVVALGVMANTERKADVWFAPAGFQRGGLSQGAAGLVVTGVETKLTSKNRDDLYDININPIASFPREGIVIFGQKTLQAQRSALDRINVRRLMLYIKKGISQISSTTLFQPNVQATWNGFKNRADAFLGDVKIRFGLDDYKVILDGTTTTPDLIDQNIMYAKIFVKPTRAIEFIAIDFIITKSGASFND